MPDLGGGLGPAGPHHAGRRRLVLGDRDGRRRGTGERILVERARDRPGQLGHRLEPLPGRLRHRPVDRVGKGVRHHPSQAGDRGRLVVRDLVQHAEVGVGLEGQLAPDHQVEDRPHREDVGPGADPRLVGLDLLRRHEARGPHAGLLLGLEGGAEDLADAEVQHLDHLVAGGRRPGADQEHVLRFQVAMDDPLLVRGLQRRAHLLRDRHHRAKRRKGDLLQTGREVLPLEVLHHHVVHPPARLVEVDDVDDVGVSEARDDLGLSAESLDHIPVERDRRLEQLDGEPLAGADVHRLVHDAHPPLPKRTDQTVCSAENGPHHSRGHRAHVFPSGKTDPRASPFVTTMPTVDPEKSWPQSNAAPRSCEADGDRLRRGSIPPRRRWPGR
jgi:hypothetical protein